MVRLLKDGEPMTADDGTALTFPSEVEADAFVRDFVAAELRASPPSARMLGPAPEYAIDGAPEPH